MFDIKCKLCGKQKGSHKSDTLQCPVGMKTRIGYTSFGENIFIPRKSRKKIDRFQL